MRISCLFVPLLIITFMGTLFVHWMYPEQAADPDFSSSWQARNVVCRLIRFTV